MEWVKKGTHQGSSVHASEGMFPEDSGFVIVKLRQRTKMIKSE